MGVVDNGFTDPAKAVVGADLVVLATPLGLYRSIFEAIAPHIKPGTVITDVGSVKHFVVESAVLSLPSAHLPFFVPGHPVAGSEKSGVEASSADLYQHKRVVLTPMSSTNPKALHQVRALWETCGALVEFMEPDKHDRIYAENSHIVQLTAYSFLSSMLVIGKKALQHIPDALDEEFRKFIRLGGSNPSMWSEIFIYNRVALLQVLDRLQHHIASFYQDITQAKESHIRQRFSNARNKRNELKDNLTPSISPITVDEGRVYTILLAYLIACAIMETTSDASYAGSGLKDFTSILITRGRVNPELILKEKNKLMEALHALQQKLDNLGHLIDKGQEKALVTALDDSITLYNNLCRGRH